MMSPLPNREGTFESLDNSMKGILTLLRTMLKGLLEVIGKKVTGKKVMEKKSHGKKVTGNKVMEIRSQFRIGKKVTGKLDFF